MTDKYVWRVKTLNMDTPGVLVAGSGVKEVIKKGWCCFFYIYLH